MKTEASAKEHRANPHQKSTQYYNPSHYVSEHVVSDNLFDLSSPSSNSDPLFPDDSLDFELKEEKPRESTGQGMRKKGNTSTPRKVSDFLELLKIANRKSEFRKKESDKPVEYTFKPMILDKSK